MSYKLGKYKASEQSESFCGTYYFIAPNIYKVIYVGIYYYTLLCDTWPIGIRLFTLLAGQDPFSYLMGSKVVPNIDNFFDFYSSWTEIDLPPNIEKNGYNLGFRREVRGMCLSLLQIDPSKHPQKVSDIIRHPFFSSKPIIPKSLSASTFDDPVSNEDLL